MVLIINWEKVAVLDMGGTINGILEPSEQEPTSSRVIRMDRSQH